MPDIFIEKQSEGKWHALRNSKPVARNDTKRVRLQGKEEISK